MSGNEPKAGQPTGSNPEELTRLLEIELIQKRSQWQRASSRNKNVRSASFFFLFLVVMAGLVAGYFAYMRGNEGRQQRPAETTAVSAQP